MSYLSLLGLFESYYVGFVVLVGVVVFFTNKFDRN